MYKDKKIIFKQINEQKVEIVLRYTTFNPNGSGFVMKEKVIGNIFSPSGSNADTENAIQVCGFTKAFDYWGCGLFGKPKVRTEKDNYRKYYYDSNGNKIMEQVKDIQLYFDEDTEICGLDSLDDCQKCFNTSCTCDSFKLLRAKDIKELDKKVYI